jgi:hypothetical protein
MSGRDLAQGVASLGRNGESMLVHMQPREVAGLQALAMQGGGSLTINPETGLPEAGWFGDILGAVAPIALGAMLGPGGMIGGAGGLFGMGALGAGLGTGLLGYALTGDVGKGLMAGLGGYGGANLGSSLKSFATPEIAKVGTVDVTGALPLEAGQNAGIQLSKAPLGGGFTMPAPQVAQAGAQGLQGTAYNAAKSAIPATGTIGQGAMNAIKDPVGFFKSGNGFQNALTLASPLMAIQPPAYKAPEDTSYQMKYEGPYTAQDRNLNLPTQADLTQLAAQGSPEYNYFNKSNPLPGYNKAPGYAQGGLTRGGLADLNGRPDGTVAQNTLNEGYGLGRLNNLASANAMEQAKMGFAEGGAIAFGVGGYVPTVGAPSYGIAPTDLSQVAAIPTTGAEANTPSGLSGILGNAITDPMGRTTGASQGGMGGKGGQQNPIVSSIAGGFPGKGGSKADPKGPELTMQDYIAAATRTYDPNASMAAAMDPTGAERAHFNNINPQPIQKAMGGGLKDGGFVVPADVVSHLGNGSTDAGLTALQKRHGAQPIKGAGDGMSDSIKTTIEGRQPARVADGEAYIPPEQVKRSGGAKKFYAMMDKVRKERTGTKKQGKKINPNKYLMA